MRKKPYVAIIYNEPSRSKNMEEKCIFETGNMYGVGNTSNNIVDVNLDMSEVAVLDEMNDIKTALTTSGFRTVLFNVDSNIIRLFDFLKEHKPDVIFHICESIGKESIHEMHVAGIYELMGIPYTGSNALTLGLAQNKARMKEILSYYNMPTPNFQVFNSFESIVVKRDLNYPLIVKPLREDASIGISSDSVVENYNNLCKQVERVIQQFNQPALVEEYIEGRELNVAIFGNNPPVAFPISEVDMSTLPSKYHKIISYNAKWMKGTEEYENTKGCCPARLPQRIEKQLKELALQTYNIIGGRDYARVDFRLTKDNRPYILEFNPNPDIARDAGFARSAIASGLTFNDMVKTIVEYALERVT